MAMQRMFCEPTVCCVQPSAYRLVSVRSGAAVEAMASQIFPNTSVGTPVISATFSGV